ncbi:unnamed protein product [Rotaria socialis]|uniref:Secreted protein n=1 Tax=Rotaria socialis TaxID=392032 RepID=A0A817PGQ6_9BILA|nr:unnamed protein product [Rotaria socialis]CAF3332306.1 unnamed protein product [Rotaria socialis]CAF3412726.1 unnamed protein product [Rotaria socialis]CAF3507397.1 unnamed protein product [Rotaria socialis]
MISFLVSYTYIVLIISFLPSSSKYSNEYTQIRYFPLSKSVQSAEITSCKKSKANFLQWDILVKRALGKETSMQTILIKRSLKIAFR